MKTIYIAGPMSEIAQFNYPAFHAAAKQLSDEGWNVVNPADNDLNLGEEFLELGDDISAVQRGWRFKDVLLWDLEQVIKADAVYFLKGWEGSTGASAEHAVAIAVQRRYPEYEIRYE